MLPRTIQEPKVSTALRSRPPSFPCNEGRVGGAEPCQASPMFSLSGTLLPFLAQGDLGSSHTTACSCDVRGGPRADQWQHVLS